MKASGYIHMMGAWAREGCAPLYFRDQDGHVRTGSMTIVDTGSAILGITAGHVADAIQRCCDDSTPGRRCRVGHAELSPSRLVARHPTMDLATYSLSPQLLAVAGHAPLAGTAWPPAVAAEGDLLLVGGYPGSYTSESPGWFHGMHVWFGGYAESVSERNTGLCLQIANCLPGSEGTVSAGADLGGWSGGTVFRVVQHNRIERLELTGIIYEYSSTSEIVLAHPLTCVEPNGEFAQC